MIVGADPGIHGGVALLDGPDVAVWRTPVVATKVNGKWRERIDPEALLVLAHDLAWLRPRRVVLEHVNGFGGQSGSTSFVFGKAAGLLEMAFIAAGLGAVLVRVPPATWKPVMKAQGDKNAARARASELLPAHAKLWRRARDDGLAEAALLAIYGRDRLKTS